MVSMFAESLDDEGEKESNNSETTERVESRACCLHDAQQTLSSFQVQSRDVTGRNKDDIYFGIFGALSPQNRFSICHFCSIKFLNSNRSIIYQIIRPRNLNMAILREATYQRRPTAVLFLLHASCCVFITNFLINCWASKWLPNLCLLGISTFSLPTN